MAVRQFIIEFSIILQNDLETMLTEQKRDFILTGFNSMYGAHGFLLPET
jgi:hypothetical protein